MAIDKKQDNADKRISGLRLTVAGVCVKHGNQGKKASRFSENGTTVNN